MRLPKRLKNKWLLIWLLCQNWDMGGQQQTRPIGKEGVWQHFEYMVKKNNEQVPSQNMIFVHYSEYYELDGIKYLTVAWQVQNIAAEPKDFSWKNKYLKIDSAPAGWGRDWRAPTAGKDSGLLQPGETSSVLLLNFAFKRSDLYYLEWGLYAAAEEQWKYTILLNPSRRQ